jgi:thermitase
MIQGRITIAVAVILFSINGFSKTTIKQEPFSVPGEYIVKIKADRQIIQKNERTKIVFSKILNAEVKNIIPSGNLVVIKKSQLETKDSVISNLITNDVVEYVEPNYVYSINKTPNDPNLENLWGIKNLGQTDSSGSPGVIGIDIEAEKAWDIETGSDKVIVAVIDTGIDYNHPDLKENMWTNNLELNGKPNVDDDNNGFVDDVYGYSFAEAGISDPMDDHGHGSHCAGTIGGVGDDGKGIVGVAWKTKLMAVKFLSASGSGSLEGAIESIDYATKMGAHILSNSWGGGGFSQALKESIERSHQAGAVFVAAAGNDGESNDEYEHFPSNYEVPNVISVAAIDNKGRMANFTNWGKKTVHVAAPGVNIFSSLPNSNYASWSGTSMATPHVSGIAALVMSHDVKLSNVDVKNRIMATVRPYGELKTKIKSKGFVSAYGALTNTIAPPDMNDPDNWQSTPYQLESEHPYKSNSDQVFEVNLSNANEFALYFEKFETEKNYDTVSFYDKDGNLLAKLSGNLSESHSPIISGNYVKIVLKSDDSVEKFGFKISKISYR